MEEFRFKEEAEKKAAAETVKEAAKQAKAQAKADVTTADSVTEAVKAVAKEIKETAEKVNVGTPEQETEAPERKRRVRAAVTESMDDYTDESEASLKKIHAGDVMECTVVAVDETAVSVDLDYYAPGRIPVEEMSEDPLFSVFSDVQIGDIFQAVVTSADDGAGNIVLSKKEADADLSWEKLEQMKEDDEVIEGIISGVTNSGAILYVEGIRGFIPASKLDLKYVEDTNPYLNKKIRVNIAEVDKNHRKLILSAREILVEQAAEKRLQDISRLSVGSVFEGTVEKIMDYGAFVNIGGGLSGLLHVSQISENRITHPKAVLKLGQKVKVKIIRIENGKISLSMRAAKEAEEEALNEEVTEYKSEYVPNNPFAALLKDIKIDN